MLFFMRTCKVRNNQKAKYCTVYLALLPRVTKCLKSNPGLLTASNVCRSKENLLDVSGLFANLRLKARLGQRVAPTLQPRVSRGRAGPEGSPHSTAQGKQGESWASGPPLYSPG
jgi:hypothetical protein